MSLKKTLLFFLVFASIGIYYYLVEVIKVEKTKQIKQEKSRIFSPIKKEEISEVKIEKEEKMIRLVKENERWKIKEPVDADVDEEMIKIWLDYVVKFQKERVVLEKSDNLGEFGLQNPPFSLHVIADNFKPFTVYLGDETPTGNMLYGKLKSKDAIFLVAAYNKNGVDKTAFELRDKNIFHFKKNDVQSFEVLSYAGTYSVEKEDKSWKVVSPKEVLVDTDKVTSLLQKIKTTEIKKFVEEKADDLIPYGLKDPFIKIVLYIGKERAQHVLTLGKTNMEEKGVYATSSLRNNVFILEEKFLQEFPIQLSDIRDRSILRFNNNEVVKVQFIYPEKTITAVLSEPKEDEKNWEIVEPRKLNADNFKIKTLLEDIKKARIMEFVPNGQSQKKTFALDKPRLIFKLFEKDNDRPKLIAFGMENRQQEAVYVTDERNDEVMLVGKELYSKLNMTEIRLRSKFLLAVDDVKIASIKIKTEDNNFLMTKSKNKWSLNKPQERKLDTINVKEILWNLGDIKFRDIIAEESDETNLTNYGLENSSAKVRVDLLDDKGNHLESLFIGVKIKNKDLLYAMNNKSGAVFSIEPVFKDNLLNDIKKLIE